MIFSCKNDRAKQSAVLTTETKREIKLKYTGLFSITEYEGYTEVVVNNPWDLSNTFATYILVPKGSDAPKGLSKDKILVRTPIDNVVTLASPHIGLFSAISSENRIIAVGESKYVYNSNVQDRFKQGEIKEVGVDQNLNLELLIDLSPEIVMATAYKQIHDNLSLVIKYGIPVVYNISWMEHSPLARAEWIKFAGVFLDKNKEADSLFNHIESSYINAVEKAKVIENKPKVLLGKKFKGTWYMAGGNSYFSQFLRDAGANYYWHSDTTSGSLPLSFEEVLDKQLDSDIWLNPGSALRISEIISEDERYKVFKALKNKKVYSNSKQLIESSANGYWETGPTNPHIVLNDLIHILHPDLSPNYELVYYEKLEE